MENKKKNWTKSTKERNFFLYKFSGFIGLSYLWKRERGRLRSFGAAVFIFFERGATVLLFLAMRACNAAYGWREKTASGISMYCWWLGKYDAPLTNDDLIPEDWVLWLLLKWDGACHLVSDSKAYKGAAELIGTIDVVDHKTEHVRAIYYE